MLYLPPLLRLHSSNINNWQISFLLISDNNILPNWQVSNDKDLQINKWQLLYADTLDEKPVYFYQSGLIYNLQADISKIQVNINHENQIISRILNFPAKGVSPRISYSSCNGFSSLQVLKDCKQAKFNMWDKLYEQHQQNPFELMLMGGDQIYMDAIFYQKNSDFYAWLNKPQQEQMDAPWTENMQQTAKRFYLKQYLDKWSLSGGDKFSPQENHAFNYMISNVPSIMMWDDHDIIDGWGSFKTNPAQKTIYSGLFEIAQLYFCLFQQHRLPKKTSNKSYLVSDNHINKSAFYILGDVGLLVLDLRSERTYTQIISSDSWQQIFATTEEILKTNNFKHLLVMSSIPIAHPDLYWLESKLDSVLLPNSVNDLTDDLHDQWASRQHLDERKILINQLLDYAMKYQVRISILSGDVHIAANGIIQSQRNNDNKNARTINQITSSGIVHPAPSKMLALFYGVLNKPYQVDRDIFIEMLNMPNINKAFIAARNFVTIDKLTDDSLQVCWHIEEVEYPFKKWIHKI